MNKIFTFGDGYAAGHLWPEWPQILSAMLPDYEIVNTAGIGAGPEWLVHQFVKKLPNLANSTVIFQWPIADRFDKLIEDAPWQAISNADPGYSFNQYVTDDETWWLSSATNNAQVQNYLTHYVQKKQHHIRKKNYQILVKNTAENLNSCYIELSTIDQVIFSKQARFELVRQHEIQPSPLVHFAFIIEQILPQLTNIKIDYVRINKLQDRINEQKWVAYDPDRAEIWQKISAL